MDFQNELLELRGHAQGSEIAQLINGSNREFKARLDAYIQTVLNAQNSGQRTKIPTSPVQYFSRILQELYKAGLTESEVDSFSSQFGDHAHITVLSILALVLDLDIGFSWAPGLVGLKCLDLEFDKDGLLVGPSNAVDFSGPRRLVPGPGGRPFNISIGSCKTGIGYKDLYVIPFHNSIERYNLGLSGGFLREISNFVAGSSTTKIRVKISQDILIDMVDFSEMETRAYIRGPIGMSPAKLQTDSFPENPRGDVTEHLWVDNGSRESEISKRFFPIKGFQVMWSRNGALKTCQAEEIVRATNKSAIEGSLIYNRYVHAIWDTDRGCFSHFDGGIRGYKEEDYIKRESLDIRDGRELSTQYVKLWRLDGGIPFAVWAELFVKFFHQNYLALEYIEAGL